MELQELVKTANNIIAFTGAGISTESGIPDFRSTSGLYMKGEFEGYTPERILSSRFFRENKKVFFSFYKQRIMSMRDKKPNRTHFALKKLEDSGKLKLVINQNIDNLLQSAGIKNVLDLHGNITQFRCISSCKGKNYTADEFMALGEIPKCECGGVLRPNVVLFDEWLDDDTFDKAYYAAKQCDLMIAIGSSLVVRPACSLISEIGDTCKLVIINRDVTPYNKRADLIINKDCGDVMEELSKSL